MPYAPHVERVKVRQHGAQPIHQHGRGATSALCIGYVKREGSRETPHYGAHYGAHYATHYPALWP